MERPQDADVVVERQHDEMARGGDYGPEPERLQAQAGARVYQVHLKALGQQTVDGEAEAQQERRVQIGAGQAEADVQGRRQRPPDPQHRQQQDHVEYYREHAQRYQHGRERDVQKVRVLRVHHVVFPRVVRHRSRVVAPVVDAVRGFHIARPAALADVARISDDVSIFDASSGLVFLCYAFEERCIETFCCVII